MSLKALSNSGSGSSGGSGTVTAVSVNTSNGVSGSVANPTTTPAITIALGAIVPTSVNGLTISTSTGTLSVTAGAAFTVNTSLSFTGTGGTTMTFPATSATIARTDAANTFTGTQTIGALIATTVNGNTITTGTGTLTLTAGSAFTVNTSLTVTGTSGTTMTFPPTSQTIAGLTSTQTLTNKTLTAPTISGAGTMDGMTLGATTPMQMQGFRPLNTQTFASSALYTTILSDNGSYLVSNTSNANTFVIPNTSSVAYPLAAEIDMVQLGTGVLTISAASGVTLNGSSGGSVSIGAQYSGASLKLLAANTWLAVGFL